ncbi:MAG: hypothetical protein US45_C0037G0014 [Candidatus Nomurabacteria bacterium GW2011_GWA1_37_20]|uniref:Uncharacterized protein n=1 Tax=Candidatus Nomurabacteria bacterium GW2011_GWA1_37_20 TaxID=1618729 RepID=A0A0G0H083_9BACT|nr:MAG: hypothetical protein US45_C0037G0014 [Candidatus Nomurabacteria bacterium GW2011_GWA1_37_20]
MDQKAQFEKKLIAIEIELGFLRVPKEGVGFMAPESGAVWLKLDEDKPAIQSTWNKKHQRIFGLTNFYKEKNAKPGDKVTVEFISSRSGKTEFYKLNLAKATLEDIKREEITEKEAEEIIDLSGLSSQAKGNIVEDRIKELILLYGQGLLNVYKPTNDTEGIDLIVVKNGVYQPLFLQVKSNYKLHGGRNLLVQVGDKTLHPHHTLFVAGVYFNPKELEINDKLAFIPSEVVYKEGQKVKLSGSNTGHRVTISLKDGSTAKFTEYLVKKTDFVNKLLEKFAEIERYYK